MAKSSGPGPAIGIVGAGAGGLSMARILTDRGLANVTVLERADRIGGKSLTVPYQGVPHEMGACYTTSGYTHALRWMEEFGIERQRLPRHVIHLPDGTPQDFRDFVLGSNKVKAYLEIARYLWVWWRRFFTRQHFARKTEAFDKEFSKPFGTWLDENGFAVVKRFSWRTITAMGYGHIDEVPALNGLRWNVPSLILSAAAVRVDEPIPGYTALWQNIAWNLDVRLEHHIERVTRHGDRFEVETNHGTLHFDHLVISSPLDDLATWMELRGDEEEYFSAISWGEYVTTLVVAEGWFQADNTHSFAANLYGANGERRGHLMVARRTGPKTPVSEAREEGRPDVYVCYQYGGEGMTDEVLEERLAADIAAQGGRLIKVLTRSRWKYMPRMSPEAIASGNIWRLRELQGKQNTWYTGASLSHEAVDNIVDFNMQLADRMEYRLKGFADRPMGKPGFLAYRRWQHYLTIHNK